jgi:hypothetical protein
MDAAAEARLNNRGAQLMADRADPPTPAPRPRETAEIHRRIVAGFYDRPDVVRETASRMLQRHALTTER